jgi:hypothetical protein
MYFVSLSSLMAPPLSVPSSLEKVRWLSVIALEVGQQR